MKVFVPFLLLFLLKVQPFDNAPLPENQTGFHGVSVGGGQFIRAPKPAVTWNELGRIHSSSSLSPDGGIDNNDETTSKASSLAMKDKQLQLLEKVASTSNFSIMPNVANTHQSKTKIGIPQLSVDQSNDEYPKINGDKIESAIIKRKSDGSSDRSKARVSKSIKPAIIKRAYQRLRYNMPVDSEEEDYGYVDRGDIKDNDLKGNEREIDRRVTSNQKSVKKAQLNKRKLIQNVRPKNSIKKAIHIKEWNKTKNMAEALPGRPKSNAPTHEKLTKEGKRQVNKAVMILLVVLGILIGAVLLAAICSKISPKFAEWVAKRNSYAYTPLKNVDRSDFNRKATKRGYKDAESCNEDAAIYYDVEADSIKEGQEANLDSNQPQISENGFGHGFSEDNDIKDTLNEGPDSLDMSSLSMIYMGIDNVIESDSSSEISQSSVKICIDSEGDESDSQKACIYWPSSITKKIKDTIQKGSATEINSMSSVEMKMEANRNIAIVDKKTPETLMKDVIGEPENSQLPINHKYAMASGTVGSSDSALFQQGIYETFSACKKEVKKTIPSREEPLNQNNNKAFSEGSEASEEELLTRSVNDTLGNEKKGSNELLGNICENHIENAFIKTRKINHKDRRTISKSREEIVKKAISSLRKKKILADRIAIARSAYTERARKQLERIEREEERRKRDNIREFKNMNYKLSYGCSESEKDLSDKVVPELKKIRKTEPGFTCPLKQYSNEDMYVSNPTTDDHNDKDESNVTNVLAHRETNEAENHDHIAAWVDFQEKEKMVSTAKDSFHLANASSSLTASSNSNQIEYWDTRRSKESDIVTERKLSSEDKMFLFDESKWPTVSQLAKRQLEGLDAVMKEEPLIYSCGTYKTMENSLKEMREQYGSVYCYNNWENYDYIPPYRRKLPRRIKEKDYRVKKSTKLRCRSSNSLFEGDGKEVCSSVWTAAEYAATDEMKEGTTGIKAISIKKNCERETVVESKVDIGDNDVEDGITEVQMSLSLNSIPKTKDRGSFSSNEEISQIQNGEEDLSSPAKVKEHSFDERENAFICAKSAQTSSVSFSSERECSSNSSIWEISPMSSLEDFDVASNVNECSLSEDHGSGEYVVSRDVAVKEAQSRFDKSTNNDIDQALIHQIGLTASPPYKASMHLRRAMSDSGISILAHSNANTSHSQNMKKFVIGAKIKKSKSAIKINEKTQNSSVETLLKCNANVSISNKCIKTRKMGRVTKNRWKFLKRFFKKKNKDVELMANSKDADSFINGKRKREMCCNKSRKKKLAAT